MYAKIQNTIAVEWPVQEFQIRSAMTNVSLPSRLTPEDVAGLGFEPYATSDKPEFDALVQDVQESTPVKQGSTWVQQWTVVEKYSAEEKAAYIVKRDADALEEKKAFVRADRNKRLAETDWRFRSDMNPSQEWKDYCQALRDVTSQPGFPWTITWPEQPQ